MLKTSEERIAGNADLSFEDRQVLARAAQCLSGDLSAALTKMAKCAYPASDKEIEHYVSFHQ